MHGQLSRSIISFVLVTRGMYVIVTNAVTLVRNEFRPFVACTYTIERAHMHLDTREFTYVHTHKCKRSFLCAFACVRLRACSCAGLIKIQNRFARKNRKPQTRFQLRNFQDVLQYISAEE